MGKIYYNTKINNHDVVDRASGDCSYYMKRRNSSCENLKKRIEAKYSSLKDERESTDHSSDNSYIPKSVKKRKRKQSLNRRNEFSSMRKPYDMNVSEEISNPYDSLFHIDTQYFHSFEFYLYLSVVVLVQIYGIYITVIKTIEFKNGWRIHILTFYL